MPVKIETYFDGEFWCARGIAEDIFTQGKTLDELYQNIKEAVSVHYGEIGEPICPYQPFGYLSVFRVTAFASPRRRR